LNRAWVLFAAVLLVGGAWVASWTWKALSSVNEPAIEARHHVEIAERYPELIADDSSEVRLLYRYLDSPVDVFAYRSRSSLEAIFAQARKEGWVKETGSTLDSDRLTLVRDSPEGRSYAGAAHVWARREGLFVVAVYQEERFLDWEWLQAKIRGKVPMIPK
jgi:hypothetical protein